MNYSVPDLDAVPASRKNAGVVCLTPEDARWGFAMAGARQVIANVDNINEVLARLLASLEQGVVIMDERLLAGLAQKDFQAYEARFPGIVIILPAPAEDGKAVGLYTEELIRRAVGYHVRLSL